jgi:hypothetical protein
MKTADLIGHPLAYRAARARPELEARDFCGIQDRPPSEALAQALGLAAEPTRALAAAVGARIIGGGMVIRDIRGMGKVYDWRTSPWTPANGGRINPLLGVHHIPVIPNMSGIADFIRLRDVLVAQGLLVQTATDRDGNVALFTPFDILCYHAKGANQLSWGCEHMHMSVGESWSKQQLRASAWIVQLAQRQVGTPLGRARMLNGNGVVGVLRRGQTTHEAVAHRAGFNDRSDPGDLYDFEYVRHCVSYFRKHEHFANA